MKLVIEKGREIKLEVLHEIDKLWQKTFTQTYKPLEDGLSELGDFSSDTFFILNEGETILSVGRLRPIRGIKIGDKHYNVEGIADIVSVTRGKGHGKSLMKGIKKYLTQNKVAGIGFCKRTNSDFYRKCGFGIGEDLVSRFVFKDKKGKPLKNTFDDDVIFSSRGKSLIREMEKNPNEKVYVQRESW